jgi:subtilase family serine protease
MIRISSKTLSSALLAAACFASTSLTAPAQASGAGKSALQPRITAPIENANRVTLAGSRSPLANPATDLGEVPAGTKLQGISLLFSRTPAQETALDALITAQQTPGSPLYHQWLTPDQFAAQFGVADSDIAAVESWLQTQGFGIDAVSRSRNRIVFSGTAGMVASAFGAPLHYFKSSSASGAAETHFAPASDLTLPAALSSSVMAITNLSDFRPHPHIKFRGPQGARPAFTSSQTGSHFLTPGDIATIYDVGPAYSAGFTGSNQSIAIIGQSDVSLTDISNFQTAVNIAAKAPILVLVPNTGTSTTYTGDEAESDLDLEYSSTMAMGAQVYFVYSGSDTNADVFTALEYAVDERIAPIISSSYGACETALGSLNYTTFNAYLQQASTQGQTVVSAAGDSGSTDCYGDTDVSTADQEALSVDFPASSQYVTAIGGTEFPAADVAVGNNTYFAAQTTTDVVSSALSYIPETAWNDDVTFASEDPSDPVGAGGGGVSVFTPRPTWQAGTIGGVAIASGTYRLVPDISFTASPIDAPFAYCTSDTTSWSTGQEASCNSGLRDASSGDLTVAGGTSFDAPTFAGMLALILQSQNSTGEGLINPTLYTLAATSATYGSAFHDTTVGGNQCLSGSSYCTTSGASEYATATGYDEATGLGSIDLYKLLMAWPAGTGSALVETSTTLVAASAAPDSGATDTITITVGEINFLTPAIGIPTGTVALTVDGVAPTAATTLTLVNGVATYSFSSTTAGAHVIVATYSGDTLNGASTGTLVVNIGATVVGSFTVAAGNISVASGSSASSTLTVTPSGGYTGTVDFTVGIYSVSSGGDADLADSCYSINNDAQSLTVTGTTAATTPITIYTNYTVCTTTASSGTVVKHRFVRGPRVATQTPHQHVPSRSAPVVTALAGLLALGLLRKRFRRMAPLVTMSIMVVLLGVASLGLSGCSNNTTTTGGGTTTTTGDETPGTYVLTLTGTDPVTNQTASSNFTLTIN